MGGGLWQAGSEWLLQWPDLFLLNALEKPGGGDLSCPLPEISCRSSLLCPQGSRKRPRSCSRARRWWWPTTRLGTRWLGGSWSTRTPSSRSGSWPVHRGGGWGAAPAHRWPLRAVPGQTRGGGGGRAPTALQRPPSERRELGSVNRGHVRSCRGAFQQPQLRTGWHLGKWGAGLAGPLSACPCGWFGGVSPHEVLGLLCPEQAGAWAAVQLTWTLLSVGRSPSSPAGRAWAMRSTCRASSSSTPRSSFWTACA